MGFFKGSPEDRLRKEATDNPSPETIVALAQKLIEVEKLEEALSVAEKGLQTFAGSGKIKDTLHFIKKRRSADLMRGLHQELKVKPSANVYAQLAQVYTDLDDTEQALDLLDQCVEEFPDAELAFFMLGQIRMEHFLREAIAYDGMHAWEALEKVHKINPKNSKARQLLAQFYYALGANALSVQLLQEEHEQSPTAMDIKDFLDDMGDPPPLSKGVTIESLIERAEDEGALPNSLKGFPRVSASMVKSTTAPPKLNPSAAQSKIKELSEVGGMRNVIVLDRDGGALASSPGTDNALNSDAFRDLVTEVCQVAGDSCRAMDIGSMTRGGVYFPDGGLAFHRQRGLVFAALFQDPLKHDKVANLLRSSAGDMVGGLSHA
ncbi:MAG: tetratricopeptide repeat protein [Planctomycetota bacterium]|jgi:tetratricopeptide (TPR) repeat protein